MQISLYSIKYTHVLFYRGYVANSYCWLAVVDSHMRSVGPVQILRIGTSNYIPQIMWDVFGRHLARSRDRLPMTIKDYKKSIIFIIHLITFAQYVNCIWWRHDMDTLSVLMTFWAWKVIEQTVGLQVFETPWRSSDVTVMTWKSKNWKSGVFYSIQVFLVRGCLYCSQ